MSHLHFPSLEVLTLALTSLAVPAQVQVAPCNAVLTESDGIFVQPTKPLSSKVRRALQGLGVKVDRRKLPAIGTAIEASCWMQLVPVKKRPSHAEQSPGKAVLFRIGTAERFASLVSEMLRLNNDRQSYRFVQSQVEPGNDADLPDDASTVPEFILLRVIDPPYYTLVDVLDAVASESATGSCSEAVAYYEQAPRVWVQLGYQHPLAFRIDPAAGQFLLIDPPHTFQPIVEDAFLEVYRALDVRVPELPAAWQPVARDHQVSVNLRLAASTTVGSIEMWVVRERALEQLQQLIQRSDDQLIARLNFAVVESPGDDPVVVLRTRPARSAPPVLVLDAQAYSSYLKLPNLFLPLGSRLQPPLRRDAVGKLLAADNREVTWLESTATAASERYADFMPYRIPDAAFRPLSDWVEYMMDRQREPLKAWVDSHSFNFDEFLCKDDVIPKTKDDDDDEGDDQSKSSTKKRSVLERFRKPKTTETQFKDTSSSAFEIAESFVPLTSGTDLIDQLKQLEKSFIEATDPVDSLQRVQLWQSMGQLNAQLHNQLDSTICWSNVLWSRSPSEEATTAATRQWLQAELQASKRPRADATEIERLISIADVQVKDAALVAAYVVEAMNSTAQRTQLRVMAAQLVQFFQRQERYLPVRVAWLVALATSKLTGGDTLALARARDRLLDRLYQHGLMAEYDVASFLRSGGTTQSDQQRVLRVRLPELMGRIEHWIVDSRANSRAQTPLYARLMFAFGLVRLGEIATGREMADQAMNQLNSQDLVHLWSGMAFHHRIEQAALGKNDRDPLSDYLLKRLKSMDETDRYKIDRLRSLSRIIEPHDRIDPYRRWHRRYEDDLHQTLAELKDITDLQVVAKQLESYLAEFPSGERGQRVLATALEYAPRMGDVFAIQLLARAEKLLTIGDDPIERALLLNRAIYVAAHFGHNQRVNWLVDILHGALPQIVDEYLRLDSQYNPNDKVRIETVESLLQQSFRGLRKLGMRDELTQLYGRVAALVETHHQQAAAQQSTRVGSSDRSLARRWHLLLCVASGWSYFGQFEKAAAVLDSVKQLLFSEQLPAVDQRRLAIAYVQAAGQAPGEQALSRIIELFMLNEDGQRRLPNIKDTMTTSSHFSVSQLELIEASILALLSEDATLNPQMQLWLDQDEFAIRKRIHSDMQLALNQRL